MANKNKTVMRRTFKPFASKKAHNTFGKQHKKDYILESNIFKSQNNTRIDQFQNAENETMSDMSRTGGETDGGTKGPTGSVPQGHESTEKESSTADSSDNTTIDSNQDVANLSPPTTVRGEFDERGGFLTSNEHNVFLFVPPGAIGTQAKELTMRITPPQDTPTKKHVMPIIEMGPEGTHFKRPVYVCYQRKNNSSKAKVCVDIKQTDDEWKHAKEQDASYFVDEKEISIGLWHFTRIRASNALESISDNEEECSVEGATAPSQPFVRQDPVEADDMPSNNPGASNTQTAHVTVYERPINSNMRHLTCYVMKDLDIMVKLSNMKGIQATGLPQPMSLCERDGDVSVQLRFAEVVEDRTIKVATVYKHGYSGVEFIITTHRTNIYKLHVQQGCEDNGVDILVTAAATTMAERTCLPLLLRYKLLTNLDDPKNRRQFIQFLKEQLGTKDEEIDTYERLQRCQQKAQQSDCGHLLDIFEMKVRSQHEAPEDGLGKLLAHCQAKPDSIAHHIQELLYPETYSVIRQPEGDCEGGERAEASAPQQVQMRSHKKPQGNKPVEKDSAYMSVGDAFLVDKQKGVE